MARRPCLRRRTLSSTASQAVLTILTRASAKTFDEVLINSLARGNRLFSPGRLCHNGTGSEFHLGLRCAATACFLRGHESKRMVQFGFSRWRTTRDVALLQEMLSAASLGSYVVTPAGSLASATLLLAGQTFDCALLDLSLPDSHGLDTIDHLSAAGPSLPIVVMTGLTDEAVARQAVRRGAQDYLIKGQTDGRTLIRALRYAHGSQAGRRGPPPCPR